MLLIEPYTLEDIFYIHDLMPCCGNLIKYYKCNHCINPYVITCFFCNESFYIHSPHLIEKI